jgi:RHS repeat-associated protein
MRRFLWDGENVLAETDSGGSTVARYTLGPELYGALVSQRRSRATSFHHGVHPERSRRDALGSTRQLSDGSQGVLNSYLYRAFGEQTQLSGTTPNPFTWVGRLGYVHQPDTDDYWVRARVYRPRMGRWISRDPEWRLRREAYPEYAYGPNDPVSGSDPSGEVWWKPWTWFGKPKPEDWGKKAAECAKKCINAKEWSKCMADCMGKRLTRAICCQHICIMLPKLCTVAGPTNPCLDKKRDREGRCGDCCEVQYECCLMTTKPSGWAACRNAQIKCEQECLCDPTAHWGC